MVGHNQHVDLISESLSLQVVEELLQLFAHVDKTLSHLKRAGTSRVAHVVDVLPVGLRTYTNTNGRRVIACHKIIGPRLFWTELAAPHNDEVNAINSSAARRVTKIVQIRG